jgi:hypothetical protein
MPDNEIASPLQEIIRKAMESKAEGPIAKLRKRFDGCSPVIVALVDVSSSMNEGIGALGLSKYQHLQAALKDVFESHPRIKIIAFGWKARMVDNPTQLPAPDDGDTDLAAGLALAARLKPRKTIVISDGLPTNADRALKVAEKMTGSIDTIYCGQESHDEPIAFLRQLARETGGTEIVWDGYKASIGSTIRAMLEAPGGNP